MTQVIFRNYDDRADREIFHFSGNQVTIPNIGETIIFGAHGTNKKLYEVKDRRFTYVADSLGTQLMSIVVYLVEVGAPNDLRPMQERPPRRSAI